MKIRLLVILCVAALTGCEVVRDFNKERYGRNNEAGDAWLSDQMLPPQINVSGNWKSSDWGDTYLGQNGAKVGGHLGDYPVNGVVSGDKVYLLVSQGGWYYYSATLEMPGPNMLIGYYSRTVPYKANSRDDIRLDRSF